VTGHAVAGRVSTADHWWVSHEASTRLCAPPALGEADIFKDTLRFDYDPCFSGATSVSPDES